MENEQIEQPQIGEESAQTEPTNGSIMGKFRDATSLLKAYNNLQAEFTRKSQKLAELTKQKENADELSKKEDNASPDSAANGTETGVSENSSCNKILGQNADFDMVLSQKLLKFAENQPSVINSIEDVKQELTQNAGLIDLPNGVDIAYRLATTKGKKEPAELAIDPQFIQKYVLENDQIKTMVIDSYIKSLAEKSSSPKLISGASAAVAITPNAAAPKTLSEANKIFSKMLEK